MDDDETGNQEAGLAGGPFLEVASGEREADDEDEDGEDWSKKGRDVDGEVHGDVVQRVTWLGPDWAEYHVRVTPWVWTRGFSDVGRRLGDVRLAFTKHLYEIYFIP